MAILQIKIPKGGKDATLSVNSDEFTDDEVYANIFKLGLETALNLRMSKVGPVTKLTGAELDKAHASAMTIASENLIALKSGEFKFPGAKAKSAEPREVINEAHRLAKEFIRDQIKASGYTVSHIPPKDITAAAKALVDKDTTYIERAKESLAARKAVPTSTIDLAALGIRPDPVKVEKAAKAKEERNTRAKTLSKTQAGKVAPRAKPKAPVEAVIAAASQGHQHPPGAVH